VAGQSIEEVMNADYWQAGQDVMREAAKNFNNVDSNEADMMQFTKNYTMRHRLNRELDITSDFRKKYMTKEYGNYQKYDTNKIETKYDEGVG